jgi:hypothetical protein
MREKIRRPARRRRRPTSTSTASNPAEWLLWAELGWGVPHPNLAVLAAAVLGVRGVARLADRLVAWIARRAS